MPDPILKCPQAGDSIAKSTLCPLICACNQTPTPSATGANLKQQCVSNGLKALDKSLGHNSPVKAEVNYDMTQSPPAPIMSGSNGLRPTDWLPTHTKDIPNFVPGEGMVRRPDAVIVRDPERPPTQDNLLEVVEIKFPPIQCPYPSGKPTSLSQARKQSLKKSGQTNAAAGKRKGSPAQRRHKLPWRVNWSY